MKNRMVHLGFEVGTGEEVSIPLGHMVVTGQSQLSGKTTTLEALVARAGVSAISFVTKRGEGAFANAHRVLPYFKDQADWPFVEALLAASQKQRMKFERAWIMKASRGAKTLADVRRNAAQLRDASKRGMDADIFMLLVEYLDRVLPELKKLPTRQQWNPRGGLSVMDLGAYSSDVQALVIRTVLEQIYEKETGVVTIIPEAWEFVPQSRGTPVKAAAEAVVRKGAVLHNFVWFDSQDLAGVDKTLLRSASVWLLGVQRERNEVKRALEQLPAGIRKPKADDVASLQIGQFWVCTPAGARRAYVQPAWADEGDARQAAIDGAQLLLPVSKQAAYVAETISAAIERPFSKRGDWPLTIAPVLTPHPLPEPEEETDMTKGQEEKLDRLLDSQAEILEAINSKLTPLVASATGRRALDEPVAEAAAAHGLEVHAEEALFNRFVERLRNERPSALLKVLAQRPELRVEIDRPVLKLDGGTLRGRISQLVAEGFFNAVRDGSAVLAELARRGGGMGDRANYARELGWLTENGFLFREGAAWIATGQKVVVEEK